MIAISQRNSLNGDNNNATNDIKEFSIEFGWYVDINNEIPLNDILCKEQNNSYYKKANKIDIRDCIRIFIYNLIEYNNITS